MFRSFVYSRDNIAYVRNLLLQVRKKRKEVTKILTVVINRR